ncbi:peptidyl-prolyl cis-trans isomerase FKBP17-1, chloroplastic-like [Camellia sinensis]|uniref:peptidyl-prolyl cis-trans isomerase FKBP17-1, chloroplastic-like n=1 Tax=Camellia sinensis TaxID=4442 RepID=UPI001036D671|nr:peptidyl-prolyl cis-trans isomerase FKBP17-1, chloroplastic-like [Camellia sinensis]
MKGRYCSTVSSFSILLSPPLKVSATSSSSPKSKSSSSSLKRRAISLSAISTALSVLVIPNSKSSCWSKPEFLELQNSGGVKALDLRIGDGDLPFDGYQVAIHYYGRLAAKQGWRFDSTYDHKDDTGESIPFIFILGSGKVISGIEAAVRSMKVGGIRRVIIPPSQGYQNTSQEPIPPNFFDRQRLFTTIFNPTRLANGEGSTLGTLIFDIELVSLRHR